MLLGPLENKSFLFSVRIVRMCRYLQEQKREFVISKQVLRSGTSVGANIAEAQFSSSERDLLAKLRISLKECYETEYWINLLEATDYLSKEAKESIIRDCHELLKMLISAVNTLQAKCKD